MSRRAPAIKVAGILLTAVALVALTIYAWIRATESRRWREMEAALVALERQALSQPGVRPVLIGDPAAGNAWEHYRSAQEFIKGKVRTSLLGEIVSRSSKLDRDQIRSTIEPLGPAIEAIQKGARCGTARPAIDWRESGTQPISTHYLSYLAVVQAREWAAAGRTHDAVVLLLDGARLSADLGANAETLGLAVSMTGLLLTLDEIRDLISGRTLATTDLHLIDSALDRLDRSLPEPGVALVNAAMVMGWEFHRAPSLDEHLDKLFSQLQMKRPAISTWRFAFSERLLMADLFESQLERSRRVAATDGRSWAEASAAASQADGEVAASKNPLAQIFNIWDRNDRHFSMVSTPRERRAQLRLLRVAARYRATGEILTLEDPFGGSLLHDEKGGRLQLWSRGRDAVDDGGSGAWKPRVGKDIVLEVER